MSTTGSNKREQFHFVFTHRGSEKDRKREKQLARSHTARVNRENRPPTRSTNQSAPSQPKRLARRAPEQPFVDAGGGGNGSASSAGRSGRVGGGQQWEEIWLIGGLNTDGSSSSSSSSSSSTQTDDEVVSSALVPKPRTIAPVIGAQSSATFQLGTTPAELTRAAHYCIKVLWPDLLMDRDVMRIWWSAFREQPVIFHGFQYALTVHHDLMVNKVDWSVSRSCLLHKAKTIRLLNQILSNLSDDNIEWAILAVVVLASNELKSDKIITERVPMFEPHMPAANWISVYGRMEQVPEHGRAMYVLIQKKGGLGEIRLAGLAAMLAFSDILTASYALTKPIFPMFWREELDDLLLLAQQIVCPSDKIDVNSGRGFRQRVPSGLPQEAAVAFTNLSIVDQIMEQCRRMKLLDEHKRVVVGVRNRMQHRLLSLPSWEELDEIDQAIFKRVSYECCRLTVLLYSSAVIFPLPPHSGFPSSLLEQVVGLLTPQVLAEWDQDASLLIWVLVIGGMASFGTPQRAFLERALRETMFARNSFLSSLAVLAALKEFLWTDSACARGFDELWNSLDLDKVGALHV